MRTSAYVWKEVVSEASESYTYKPQASCGRYVDKYASEERTNGDKRFKENYGIRHAAAKTARPQFASGSAKGLKNKQRRTYKYTIEQ